jgi:hypothetical protein
MAKGSGGRPAGRSDNPMNKRVRNETADALRRRIDKTAQTRRENEAKKKADGTKSNAATSAKKATAGTIPLINFFRQKTAQTSNSASTTSTGAETEITVAPAITTTNANTQIDNGIIESAASASPEIEMPTIDSDVPVVEIANEIIVNLDVGDDTAITVKNLL